MFLLEYPQVAQGQKIEELSLQKVLQEMSAFNELKNFSKQEQHVMQRMIHATTCAEKIISSIEFCNHATEKIFAQLKAGATIICDTKMIQTGLSSHYLETYGNRTLCYVSHPDVISGAKETETTRSYVAVQKALQECREKNSASEIILACGNAPTFLYAAIEWVVKNNFNPAQVSFLAMPVGYINVSEAKDYTLRYLHSQGSAGIVLRGSYGASSLVVSALHALYRL